MLSQGLIRRIVLIALILFSLAIGVGAHVSGALSTIKGLLAAKWLTGTGSEIAVGTVQRTETSLEVLFEDPRITSAAVCSMVLVGNVEPEGKGEVSEVVSLRERPVTQLSGRALSSKYRDCVSDDGCEMPITMWPMGLPWKTQLVALDGRKVVELTLGVSFAIVCTVLFEMEDTCAMPQVEREVVNSANGDAEHPEESLTTREACTLGGSATMSAREVAAPILLTSGELLLVSPN